MSRRSVIAALSAMAASPTMGAASSAGDVPYAPAARDLVGDADLLQRAFEALHPGLHRYNTPLQVREHFALLRSELASAAEDPQWLAASYLALSRLTARIRCGHTYANFHNQSRPVQEQLLERPGRVPFEFRWLDGRMVVTRDLGDERCLPPGTEIASIEGEPAAGILGRLLPYVRADGANDGKRIALLEVQGLEAYETFDVFYGLLSPLGDVVDLEVRRPGEARVRRMSLRTLGHAQRLIARRHVESDPQSGWRLLAGGPGMAILRMPTWALYNTTWDWRRFLAQSFEMLDRHPARALVIDLRGNEGGLDVGNEILPYLTSREIVIDQPPRLVRYRDVPPDLNPCLDTWDDSFRHWGDDARPVDARYYALRPAAGESAALRVLPRKPRFTGQVFVLIGPGNSSATFQFAQDIRASGLGRLVGRTTGGNLRGINGGAFFFVRLPASGLEVDLPLIARFAPGNPPDAGLAPDVPVMPHAIDLQRGEDVELTAVRALLEARG